MQVSTGQAKAGARRGVQRSDAMMRAREKVLSLLRRHRTPLNAYDLLHRLNGSGWQLKPPQIYRLLALLQEQGLVHRVESQATFIACRTRGHVHSSEMQFLVCSTCGRVAEVGSEAVSGSLERIARQAGFQVRRQIVEVVGTCSRCLGTQDQERVVR